MSTVERINEELKALPEVDQAEILDFVCFLKARKGLREEKNLMDFSLEMAMRGMEDEPDLYNSADGEPIVK
jgi:hypothetical protein